ncbi:MAG: hypothetical protein FWD69_04935 [Polyangiaceae bacterium]|nr:hypothetical protein [Polyangiaceae bacterium]
MCRSFGLLAPLFVSSLLFISSQARAQEIAPPPPIDPGVLGAPAGSDAPSPGTAATIAQLDEAERRDSGRKLEVFWIDGEVGGSYVNMAQLSSKSLGIEQTKSGGPMFGLGAGARLLAFILGARVRYNALSAFNMWQLNGEIGFKIPFRKFDFGITAHGGYSFVGQLGDADFAMSTPTNTSAIKVRGFNAGLNIVLDYYITSMFSVGVVGFGDFLYLKRPPLDVPAGLTPAEQAEIDNNPSLYQKSGTTAGLQFGGALRLGLHFGI